MTIDTTGEYWTGTEPDDIGLYLRELKPGGYPVHRTIDAVCQGCHASLFRVLIDADDELAKTVCSRCAREAFVADSERHWGGSHRKYLKCPCGNDEYQLALGLCIQQEAWVRWMSLGLRCTHCSLLGSPLDWKSELDVSDAAATRIG